MLPVRFYSDRRRRRTGREEGGDGGRKRDGPRGHRVGNACTEGGKDRANAPWRKKKRDAERSQSGKVNKMSSNQKMNRQEQGRPETNI